MNHLSGRYAGLFFASAGLFDYFSINFEEEPALRKSLFKSGTLKIGLAFACAIHHLTDSNPSKLSDIFQIGQVGLTALAGIDLSLGLIKYMDDLAPSRVTSYYLLNGLDKLIYALAWKELFIDHHPENLIAILAIAGVAQSAICYCFESQLNSLIRDRLYQRAIVKLSCAFTYYVRYYKGPYQ